MSDLKHLGGCSISKQSRHHYNLQLNSLVRFLSSERKTEKKTKEKNKRFFFKRGRGKKERGGKKKKKKKKREKAQSCNVTILHKSNHILHILWKVNHYVGLLIV